MAVSGSRILVSCAGALLAAPIAAQGTERVSVGQGGVQANASSRRSSISADGRCVAFESNATNLAGGVPGGLDVFVRDRAAGTTELVCVPLPGNSLDGGSGSPSISADGRYVAFESGATTLVLGDTNGSTDVFVRDRVAGTTERVSVDGAGGQAHGDSSSPSISADGRYVAFLSFASDLVPGDTNAHYDVFVRDWVAGTTERVSVATGGLQADHSSLHLAISADGRCVAFVSLASNLVPGDTNGDWDVFVRDLAAGTTERVSVATDGAQTTGADAYVSPISLSADGRFVQYASDASDLVPNDTNALRDVFLRDRFAGTTERVSLTSGEGQAWGSDCFAGSLSADGRFVAFYSQSASVIPGDTNWTTDPFVRDRELGVTERAGVASNGAEADAAGGYEVSISADGRWLAFLSEASNLVAGDTNDQADVFVRDLETTGFTSLCDPGPFGLEVCPCSNPAGGPMRGCDNSSMTGGARLLASGVTHLSADTLVFTTSDEKPAALSIVLQGNGFVYGAVYGQGIRCIGGSLKRLYSKSAVAGSITAPDFGAGDPPVSVRSAAKGDVIQPGQPRWYIVYYRDPTVLGGCPATSTFNATQTGQVLWRP